MSPAGESVCLSRLALDRLLAEETRGLEGARRHLEGCASCRDRLERLRAEQAQAQAWAPVKVNAILAAAGAAAAPSWRAALLRHWGMLAGTVVTAAAATTLLLVRPGSRSDDQAGLRLKGGWPTLEVLVTRDRRLVPLGVDETLAPGMMLSFRVIAPRAARVTLVHLAEEGAPALLEADRPAPWPVEPGASAVLPVSAEVDAAWGDERLFALVCERDAAPAEALAAIERAYPLRADGRRELGRERPIVLAGCLVPSRLLSRRSDGSR